MAALVASILVWTNVFFHSDVIRVGNRTELIRMSSTLDELTFRLFPRVLTPSVNNSLGDDGIHRPPRLFRNHAQLSTFPRGIHIPTLGLSRFDGFPRIYRL
jgi:hypothetical protein